MQVLVLTGSAHRKGMSALLAEKFIEGAEEAGHNVIRIDTAFKNVHHCLGCLKCNGGENPCVLKDDMTDIGQTIEQSDVVAFAFPIYYHLMPMTLKAVLDRFYAFDSRLVGAHKKAFMFSTGWDPAESNFAPMRAWFKSDMDYLQWEMMGELNVGGYLTREELEQSDYPQKAYEMGKSLKG